jgi:limonene-1,2-epoxide hydrolase
VRPGLALALCAAALAAGCGGGSPSPETVVRDWSKALNADDNDAAADLFADGAEVIQAGVVTRLPTHRDAVLWNSELPCSGKIVALSRNGREVRATFLLGDRRGSPCDAPGARATALFRIEDGKIVLWHQLDGSGEPEPPVV